MMIKLNTIAGLEGVVHLILLVGCQRSGTTLCGQVMGAHPNAFLVDENDRLYHWFNGLYTDDAKTVHTATQTLLQRADTKYVKGQTRTHVDSDGLLRLNSHVTHLVFKAPNLTYRYEDIAATGFPTTVLYPARDVQPVISSMARLKHIPFVENQLKLLETHPRIQALYRSEYAVLNDTNESDEVRRAALWVIKTGLIDQFRKTGLPLYHFRYEDFVSHSDEHCQQMAEASALPNHPNLASHHTIYVGTGPGGTERTRPIDRQSLKQPVNSTPESRNHNSEAQQSGNTGTGQETANQLKIESLTEHLRHALGYTPDASALQYAEASR